MDFSLGLNYDVSSSADMTSTHLHPTSLGMFFGSTLQDFKADIARLLTLARSANCYGQSNTTIFTADKIIVFGEN
jgi:hypothetical protein